MGKAGELRVRSELILQGYNPAVFDHDDGTDIIVGESGKKLQVKTCRKPQHYGKSYSYKYSFAIRGSQFRKGVEGQYSRTYNKRNYQGKADYFIFWCIEHDIFYIVPESEVGGKLSIVVPTPTEDRKYRINERKSKSKYEQYRNAWHLLA